MHPLSSTAVLKFHDAVELFLGLTASHLGANVNPKIDFLEYWGQIKTQTQVALPGKADMDKLNHARVGFKHKQIIPAVQTIERCQDYTLNFLTAATPLVFGVNFDAVDMLDLVTQPEAARLLREAQLHADQGDIMHAMAGLGLAMKALMQHYARDIFDGRHPSPFAFGDNFYSYERPKHGLGQSPEASLAKTMDIVGKMQAAMRVISLGIDLPKYLRFEARVPRVDGFMDGSQSYAVAESYKSITAEEYEWSRQFVIDSSLQAGRADGLHEMLDADYRANWTASLDQQWRPEERYWTGAPETPGQEETPSNETDTPTLDT